VVAEQNSEPYLPAVRSSGIEIVELDKVIILFFM